MSVMFLLVTVLLSVLVVYFMDRKDKFEMSHERCPFCKKWISRDSKDLYEEDGPVFVYPYHKKCYKMELEKRKFEKQLLDVGELIGSTGISISDITPKMKTETIKLFNNEIIIKITDNIPDDSAFVVDSKGNRCGIINVK